MKHLIAIAALAVLFTSCKKDNISNTPSERKLVKAESINSATVKTYTYNSEGRLIQINNGSWIINYSYPVAGPKEEITDASNVKLYEARAKTMANGRVTALDYDFYSNGVLNFSELNTFQYNADGYLTNFSYGGYEYVYEITGGNYTKFTVSANGVPQRQDVIEYYTDKPNKLNINFFAGYFNMFMSDKEQFGKFNKNLIKKITRTSTPASANDFVENFTYTFDAEGYITGFTVNETRSSGATSTWGEKFYYQ